MASASSGSPQLPRARAGGVGGAVQGPWSRSLASVHTHLQSAS